MNKYDIYVAHLRFKKPDGSILEENNPILILDPNNLIVIAVKCTSHWVRLCNNADYLIKNYKGTGLNRETVIMFDYPMRITLEDILYKIGKLNNFDIKWVDNYVNNLLKNFKK